MVTHAHDTLSGLHGKTGRVLWTRHREERSLYSKNEGDGGVIVESNYDPACDRAQMGICYPVFYPIDEFCVLNMSNGEALWCEEMRAGAYVTRQADFLYLRSGNTGRAFDLRSGIELWSRKGSGGVDGAAPHVQEAEGVLYMNDRGMISALYPKSLALRWQYQLKWHYEPFIMDASDDIAILWTGAGLAAVGLPPARR